MFKQDLQNISMENIYLGEHSLHILTLTLPMVSREKRGRVKVFLLDEQLNVEPAVRKVFESSGYLVLKGEGVHLASHVVTGKFMGIDDNVVFKNWAHSYGYEDKDLDNLLAESHNYLLSFLRGEQKSELKLLDNLIKRWDIYHMPVPEKKREIRILVEFWKTNMDVFRRWVKCYLQQPYDPGETPDFFLWKKSNNKWFWAEIKSWGDSIADNQWKWFQTFASQVSDNVVIIRVLPSSVTCPHCKKTYPFYSQPGNVSCLFCRAKFFVSNDELRNKWNTSKL